MQVMLEGWIVGDGDVPLPNVGGVLRRRMLTLACREAAESVLEVAHEWSLESEAVVLGQVIWRGGGVSGDAAALDCGFPLRIESDIDVQTEKPSGKYWFSGPRGDVNWYVPVPLSIPPVGAFCAARGSIRVAAEYEMEDDMLEEGCPDVRADWLIQTVTPRPEPELNGWLLELQPLN